MDIADASVEHSKMYEEAELSDEDMPKNLPISFIRIPPFEDVAVGRHLVGQACSLYGAEGEMGRGWIVRFIQFGHGVDIRAQVGLVASSTQSANAFISWPDSARATPRMQDRELVSLHIESLWLRQVEPIDIDERGPLDGDGFQTYLEPIRVARLPSPEGIEEPPCMRRRHSVLTRQARRWFPKRISNCCTFHQVDWKAASSLAIGLRMAAYGRGAWNESTVDELVSEELGKRFPDHHSLFDQKSATRALLGTSIGIQPAIEEDGTITSYVDGRHRVQALLDQGVRETLIVRYELGLEVGVNPINNA